jgi:asparaginyl-tRNA synthetase
MIEPEIAFANLDDDIALEEKLLKYVFQYILDNADAEMDFFAQFINPEVKTRLQALVNAAFTRVSYTEAIKLLKKS